MKNAVFYFSGTGNSLALAKQIAEKLGDTEIISIPSDFDAREPIKITAERIGFVFPVYFGCLPPVLKRFISNLEFGREQYIFGVANFGGGSGLSFGQLDSALAERGAVLSAAFPVKMPGNYIIKYGAFPLSVQNKILKSARKKTDRIADTVKAKLPSSIPRGAPPLRLFEKRLERMTESFGKMAENFHADESCSGCGVCVKVCPAGNIRLKDSAPVWGGSCEHCMACIQWCPKEAINYADKTAKRKRYHHPGIKLSEMFRTKSD